MMWRYCRVNLKLKLTIIASFTSATNLQLAIIMRREYWCRGCMSGTLSYSWSLNACLKPLSFCKDWILNPCLNLVKTELLGCRVVSLVAWHDIAVYWWSAECACLFVECRVRSTVWLNHNAAIINGYQDPNTSKLSADSKQKTAPLPRHFKHRPPLVLLVEEMQGIWSGGSRLRSIPKRTWREVVQKDCQACTSNRKDAMDCSRWRKLIKDGWWSG